MGVLKDQVAFVTGCTRGIGLATLQEFLQRGAYVFGVYKSDDSAARELTSSLSAFEGRFVLKKGAIEERPLVQELVAEAIQRFGDLDILVNNAGIADDALLIHMLDQQWKRVLSTNFQGTVHVIDCALPFLLRKQRGKIINVVSLSAVTGKESQVNYSSSKGALIGLTRMIARVYGRIGIYCNAIAPGFVETDMLHAVPVELVQGFVRQSTRQRLLKPEELARVIAFLGSSDSDAFNGSVLDCDGGFLK